ARATPDWVLARSASLRVLSVGVFTPASSKRSSSAPRAIPSATAAIAIASDPNGGDADSGPAGKGAPGVRGAGRPVWAPRPVRAPEPVEGNVVPPGPAQPRHGPRVDHLRLAGGEHHQAHVGPPARPSPRLVPVEDDAPGHQPVAVGDVAREPPPPRDRVRVAVTTRRRAAHRREHPAGDAGGIAVDLPSPLLGQGRGEHPPRPAHPPAP